MNDGHTMAVFLKLGRKVTSQEILAEAYNDLFKKYGRAELAPMSGD